MLESRGTPTFIIEPFYCLKIKAGANASKSYN